MKYTHAYHGALKIQRLIEAATLTAQPKELAMLGKTFATLEFLKLRLRMKPAPKPIDTTKLQPKQQRATAKSFTEQ